MTLDQPGGAQPPNQLAPQTATPPEDRLAYRIAVAALGVSLVAFLIGAAVIAAGGKPVPTQYWATGSGIAGAIIGILAPSPQSAAPITEDSRLKTIIGPIANAIKDLWTNRALFMLMTVFGVSLAFAIAHNSSELETVAAAAGGALVGLLAPPPGHSGG
jgi:hypothetical protein